VADRLADLTWPDVGRRSGVVLAVPLGSTEQHGPHLPLSTDTDIAVALCERLAAARDDVLVAPALPYGSAGEHAGFPGTLSIGQAAVELVVLELVRSATATFDHVVLVSAHGGNTEAVTRAVRRLRAESRDVCLFLPTWDGDPHAGRPETAMLLAMSPDRVRMRDAVPGDTRPLAQLLPQLRSGGVRSVSASGILGDPTEANATEGAALLDELTAALLGTVARWRES
jgi:mycofactocin system creatininase family protein